MIARAARDGTWFYHGSPIGRIALAKLFATVLRRDDAGDFWLVTPAERGRITVEDVPFVAVEVRAEGAGRTQTLSFRTNLDEWATADADHPIRVAHDSAPGGELSDTPAPYILIPRLIASTKLSRQPYKLSNFDLVTESLNVNGWEG